MSGRIVWVETQPDLWRSIDGRYAIVRAVLPEDRPNPTETYTLRKIDPASAAAYPGTLGYFVGERYDLHGAQQEAEIDAYCEKYAGQRSVPVDLPAVALRRFSLPISNGTSQAGLAIVRDGDRLVARVVGMTRRGDDQGFEPGAWAEINLTELGVTAPAAENTTAHGPDPCPDCSVPVGAAHADGCDVARCLATGGQRLMCGMVGGRPVAGIVGGVPTIAAFRDGHDCGDDVWSGRWPGEAECEEFGWWVQDRCAEGLGFVPCAPDAPGAMPDLNRLVREGVWNPTTRRFDRRET